MGDHFRPVMLAALLAGTAFATSPAASSLSAQASTSVGTGAGVKAYVANNATSGVSVVDLGTGKVVRTVSNAARPANLVLDAQGRFVYVANGDYVIGGQHVPGVVTVIETQNDTVVASIPLGTVTTPTTLAVSPDGRTLYVTNYAEGSVTVVDTPTRAVVRTITGFYTPWGVAVSSDGRLLAVSNYYLNNVMLLDATTYATIRTINVGSFPEGVGFSPFGNKIYVANDDGGSGAAGGSVTIIETASGATIDVPFQTPARLTVHPQTGKVYVASAALQGKLAELDPTTNKILRTFNVGLLNIDVAISPDGSKAYVAGVNSNSLGIVDLTTGIVSAISGIPGANGVAVLGAVAPQTATYTLSGRVQKYKGTGVSQVAVCVNSSPSRCASSDDSGAYVLGGLGPGTYTLTASKSGVTFPSARPTVIVAGNVTGQDFTAFDRPPVVFVHGYNGLQFSVGCGQAVPEDTFGQVAIDLQTAGYYTEYAHLQSSFCFTPALNSNVPNLTAAIDLAKTTTGQRQVILVAHSMGGLVSRAYVEGGTYADDVSELFTFGTPHLGLPPALVSFLANGLSLGTYCLTAQPAACEMTSAGILTFNAAHSSRRLGVRYHAISGDAPFLSLNPLRTILSPLLLAAGPNDGFVPTSSGIGLSQSVDRWTTDEVHTTALGPADYFHRAGGPSLSYSGCLAPVLVARTPGFSCGTSQTSSRLTEAMADLPQHTPFDSGVVSANQTMTRAVTLGGGPALFATRWTGGSPNVTLTDPTGLTIDSTYAAANASVVSFQADANSATYYVPNATSGVWRLALQAVASDASNYITYTAFSSPLALTASVDKTAYSPGATAILLASLSGSPASATVTATFSRVDGSEAVPMQALGGGSYRLSYVIPSTAGIVDVRVVAAGVTANNTEFTRGIILSLQVNSSNFSLSGSYIDAPEARAPGSPNYAAITISVGVTAASSGLVGLSGDLVTPNGVPVAHAITVAQAPAGPSTLVLRFSGRDIYAGRRSGPYSLTNVILTDQRGTLLVATEAVNATTTAAYDYLKFVDRALVATAQPIGGATGFSLGIQPRITLQDGVNGAPMADNATVVALRLQSGAGTPGAVLACSQTVAGVTSLRLTNGEAVFSGCKIDLPGEGYVLEASAGDATLAVTQPFTINWAGDTNRDCKVSIVDFSKVVTHFGKSSASPDWNTPGVVASKADLNGDRIVSIVDFSIVVSRFGTVCTNLPQ